MDKPAPIAYGPRDAARMVGVSREYIYLALRRGELASYKVGSRRLIPREALLAWLEAHRDDRAPA